MQASIKKLLMSLLVTATLVSCGYSGDTLQGYYVLKQEAPNFISVDIPISFVELDEDQLTEVQKEAYESINKLNMLGYQKKDGNDEEYKAELAQVKEILKNEKYQELFRGGNSNDGRIIVKYIGTDTTIDELILFGAMNDNGFAIVRVLGNNMEPAKIMKLGDVVGKMSSEENSVEDFMRFFKGTGQFESQLENLSEEIGD